MADAIYPNAKGHFLAGDIDVDTATLKIVLVDTASYTYSTAHDALDDIPAGMRLATSGAITSKTTTSGTLDFADVTVTGLDTGETADAYVLYVDSGVEATSYLIAYKDSAAELPLAGATGVDVVVQVNASGFFTL
ncbi:MAG TPA: hypothetical protein V6D20_18550 [Candidatus Obscuribacterales bacterium]